MSRYQATPIASGYNTTSSINNELDKVEAAIGDTLSRVGDAPNQMDTELDMNSNRVLNVPDANSLQEPATYNQLLKTTTLFQIADAKFYDTVVLAQADTSLVAGDVVVIKERASALFDVISGTGTANGYDIVAHGSLSLSFVIRTQSYMFSSGFGAKGDGTTNDTLAIKAFIQYLIDNEVSGKLEGGTYKVDLGVLVFDNGHTDVNFPVIDTDGKFNTVFVNNTDINSPFLTFTNGTAASGAGKYWNSGLLDGIGFKRTTGSATNTGQHGLVLRGFNYTKFGNMLAMDIGGDAIHIEQKLFGGNNPDPYHINGCVFDGVEAIRCGGYAFYNDNFVGLAGCVITQIRAIENKGVFFGQGASNIVGTISAGSNAGWGIGEDISATGGSSSRFTLITAEFDDQEFGINANRAAFSNYGRVRFVHRYRFGPHNPAGGYWPTTGIDVGSNSCTNCTFDIIDRIEAGGAKTDVGVFSDYNNSGNISNTFVYRQNLDNAGFGFVDSDFYTNLAQSAHIEQTIQNGKKIIDTVGDESVFIRLPTTYSMPNSGFTSTSIVQYSVVLKDHLGLFNATAYEYTVPSTGNYDIESNVNMALNAGNRVRFAVVINSGASKGAKYTYIPTTGTQTVHYKTTLYLNAGDKIKITADQNTGAALPVVSLLHPDDNYLRISRA